MSKIRPDEITSIIREQIEKYKHLFYFNMVDKNVASERNKTVQIRPDEIASIISEQIEKYDQADIYYSKDEFYYDKITSIIREQIEKYDPAFYFKDGIMTKIRPDEIASIISEQIEKYDHR